MPDLETCRRQAQAAGAAPSRTLAERVRLIARLALPGERRRDSLSPLARGTAVNAASVLSRRPTPTRTAPAGPGGPTWMAAKFFCSCDGASWTKRSQLECRGLVASRTYSTSPSRPRTCKAKGSESGREGRACPAGGADISHGALLKHRPSSLRGVGHTLGRPCPPQTHARAVPVADVPVTHSCRGLSDASCVDGAFLVKVTYLRVNLNTYGSRLPSLRGKPCLRPVHPFSHRRC